MQYHACLITADRAYHCPVGSIWPFLDLRIRWKAKIYWLTNFWTLSGEICMQVFFLLSCWWNEYYWWSTVDASICKVGDYPAIQRASLLFGNSTKFPGSRPLRKRQRQKSAAHLNRQNDVKNRKHAKIQLTFLWFCPPTQRQVEVIGKKCKFSSKSSLKIIFFIYAFVTFQCILIYCLLS